MCIRNSRYILKGIIDLDVNKSCVFVRICKFIIKKSVQASHKRVALVFSLKNMMEPVVNLKGTGNNLICFMNGEFAEHFKHIDLH